MRVHKVYLLLRDPDPINREPGEPLDKDHAFFLGLSYLTREQAEWAKGKLEEVYGIGRIEIEEEESG